MARRKRREVLVSAATEAARLDALAKRDLTDTRAKKVTVDTSADTKAAAGVSRKATATGGDVGQYTTSSGGFNILTPIQTGGLNPTEAAMAAGTVDVNAFFFNSPLFQEYYPYYESMSDSPEKYRSYHEAFYTAWAQAGLQLTPDEEQLFFDADLSLSQFEQNLNTVVMNQESFEWLSGSGLTDKQLNSSIYNWGDKLLEEGKTASTSTDVYNQVAGSSVVNYQPEGFGVNISSGNQQAWMPDVSQPPGLPDPPSGYHYTTVNTDSGVGYTIAPDTGTGSYFIFQNGQWVPNPGEVKTGTATASVTTQRARNWDEGEGANLRKRLERAFTTQRGFEQSQTKAYEVEREGDLVRQPFI